MSVLSATTLRIALIDYRAELIRLSVKYPCHFKNNQTIADIDAALLEIDGNVRHVSIQPYACKP